ncbi:MAG TPA: PIN domain-containing protein [Candidatus Limnocylindrales bacterium]
MVARFVDTSYIVALGDAHDERHEVVARDFVRQAGVELTTHGYVVAETLSLVRHRLGARVTVRLIDELLPLLDIVVVDRELHEEAMRSFREAVASNVSFVDRTSFAFMRARGITTALALDADFRTAGFEVLP